MMPNQCFVQAYCIFELSTILVSMQPNCILLCAWPCHITVSIPFLTLFPGLGQIKTFPKDHLVHSLVPKQNQLLLIEEHPKNLSIQQWRCHSLFIPLSDYLKHKTAFLKSYCTLTTVPLTCCRPETKPR